MNKLSQGKMGRIPEQDIVDALHFDSDLTRDEDEMERICAGVRHGRATRKQIQPPSMPADSSPKPKTRH